jgi:hypothetical protein
MTSTATADSFTQFEDLIHLTGTYEELFMHALLV